MEIGFASYSSAMDDREEDILENTLQSFLSTTKGDLDGVSIEISSVKLKSQYRVPGVKNGLISSKLSERMILEDNKKETAIGLRVSMLVMVTVHYAVEPKVLPLEDLLSLGLKASFDDFLKGLEDEFSVNNVLKQRDGDGGSSEHNDNVTNDLPVPISVLAVVCGVVGMILGTTLLFVYNKRKNRRRNATGNNLMLQSPFEFVENQSSLNESGDEEDEDREWNDLAEAEMAEYLDNQYSTNSSSNFYPYYSSSCTSDVSNQCPL